jgi:hypothetical protein
MCVSHFVFLYILVFFKKSTIGLVHGGRPPSEKALPDKVIMPVRMSKFHRFSTGICRKRKFQLTRPGLELNFSLQLDT